MEVAEKFWNAIKSNVASDDDGRGRYRIMFEDALTEARKSAYDRGEAVGERLGRRDAFGEAAGTLALGDDLMPPNDCCRAMLVAAADDIGVLADQPPPDTGWRYCEITQALLDLHDGPWMVKHSKYGQPHWHFYSPDTRRAAHPTGIKSFRPSERKRWWRPYAIDGDPAPWPEVGS